MLRQGLVPELLTEVPLSGVHGMWAVCHRKEEDLPGEEPGEWLGEEKVE